MDMDMEVEEEEEEDDDDGNNDRDERNGYMPMVKLVTNTPEGTLTKEAQKRVNEVLSKLDFISKKELMAVDQTGCTYNKDLV